jgi:hypothetical protein
MTPECLKVICVVLERMEAIRPTVHDAVLDKMPSEYLIPSIEEALRLVFNDIKSWMDSK